VSNEAERLLTTLKAEGVDPLVIEAMARVPRHEFVPDAQICDAYEDFPLPIGLGQTISQPSLVGRMTTAARVNRLCRVLEIGTGCGYQTAILAELASQVHSIELEPSLAGAAAVRLRRLGYRNIEARVGDGHGGWPERAPFDAIVVTAAATTTPPALVDQLRRGGRLVVPVRRDLLLVSKDESGRVDERFLGHVRFVPLRRAQS
jgi:protein-L-isoaspartate(D-aspartate) O-methyltransferase